MPRLFTAIKLPEQISIILALKKGRLKGARWMNHEDYHITLSFLGDISEMEAEKAICKLGEINHKSFEICMNGIDVFGAKKPRTLFASVRGNESLMNLQARQDRAMRQIGIEIQSRKYTPHVTLARLSNVRPHDVLQFMVQKMGEPEEFAPMTFEVSGFGLYSAKNSTGGGPYLVEQEFDF